MLWGLPIAMWNEATDGERGVERDRRMKTLWKSIIKCNELVAQDGPTSLIDIVRWESGISNMDRRTRNIVGESFQMKSNLRELKAWWKRGKREVLATWIVCPEYWLWMSLADIIPPEQNSRVLSPGDANRRHKLVYRNFRRDCSPYGTNMWHRLRPVFTSEMGRSTASLFVELQSMIDTMKGGLMGTPLIGMASVMALEEYLDNMDSSGGRISPNDILLGGVGDRSRRVGDMSNLFGSRDEGIEVLCEEINMELEKMGHDKLEVEIMEVITREERVVDDILRWGFQVPLDQVRWGLREENHNGERPVEVTIVDSDSRTPNPTGVVLNERDSDGREIDRVQGVIKGNLIIPQFAQGNANTVGYTRKYTHTQIIRLLTGPNTDGLRGLKGKRNRVTSNNLMRDADDMTLREELVELEKKEGVIKNNNYVEDCIYSHMTVLRACIGQCVWINEDKGYAEIGPGSGRISWCRGMLEGGGVLRVMKASLLGARWTDSLKEMVCVLRGTMYGDGYHTSTSYSDLGGLVIWPDELWDAQVTLLKKGIVLWPQVCDSFEVKEHCMPRFNGHMWDRCRGQMHNASNSVWQRNLGAIGDNTIVLPIMTPNNTNYDSIRRQTGLSRWCPQQWEGSALMQGVATDEMSGPGMFLAQVPVEELGRRIRDTFSEDILRGWGTNEIESMIPSQLRHKIGIIGHIEGKVEMAIPTMTSSQGIWVWKYRDDQIDVDIDTPMMQAIDLESLYRDIISRRFNSNMFIGPGIVKAEGEGVEGYIAMRYLTAWQVWHIAYRNILGVTRDGQLTSIRDAVRGDKEGTTRREREIDLYHGNSDSREQGRIVKWLDELAKLRNERVELKQVKAEIEGVECKSMIPVV